jgi:XRE family transcriptional regulator, regulator of sulfur utilization
MKTFSRRDLALLLPAWAASTASAQTTKVLPSAAIKFEDLPVKDNPTSKGRAVMTGETHSGFPLEMHITELNAGEAPHAPHHHVNEEVMFLQRGLLDATVNGKTTRLTPGSVFYVYSNEVHGLHNPGPDKAQYFVVAFGNKT